jgi:hypothetical protein
MKKTVLFAMTLTIGVWLTGCNSPSESVSQEGVFTLEKQVFDDGKAQTVNLSTEGNLQYKIFTPNEYFYIAIAKDSSAGFGVGKYVLKGNNVEETNIYNSIGLDTAMVAKLEISSTEKGYKQFIPSLIIRGVDYKLTEEYNKVQSEGTSDLDGVWKQTKNLVVSSKDTTDGTYNEYKIYQKGHFMWATRYLADTTKKEYKNAVGHGTFSLNNEALTEQLEQTNLPGIVGKYQIKVTFNGKDEYTQETADTKNKTVGFKTYQRVK